MSKSRKVSNVPVLPVPAGFRFKEVVPVRDLTIVMNHHIVDVGGDVRYRIWSDSVGRYTTQPMTREQYRESRLLNALLRGGFGAMIQEFEEATFLQLSDWIGDEGASSDRRANLVTWDRQGREPLSPQTQLEITHRLAAAAREALKDSPVWIEIVATYG